MDVIALNPSFQYHTVNNAKMLGMRDYDLRKTISPITTVSDSLYCDRLSYNRADYSKAILF